MALQSDKRRLDVSVPRFESISENAMKREPLAKRVIGPVFVEVAEGDIAKQTGIAAIVNTSNRSLQPSSGVSGAIFAAAGVQILVAECQRLGPIELGQAVLTPGFGLPNRSIIHCCAPRYKADSEAIDLLDQTYWAIFELAEQNKIESLAIPAIGSGAHDFPIDVSARVAIEAIKSFSPEFIHLKSIRLVLRDTAAARTYTDELLRPVLLAENKIALDLLTKKYSRQEFHTFSKGYIGDQDSKWFVYFEDPWLCIYRGNRKYGRCHFWLCFRECMEGITVTEAWMDSELPWTNDEARQGVEDLLDSRFDLLRLADKKFIVGLAEFWVKRDRVALTSQLEKSRQLLSAEQAIELGQQLILIGESLQRNERNCLGR